MRTEEEIFYAVQEIVRTNLGLDPRALVTLESNFRDDLGCDSLDEVELVMALEDEFGFEVPDWDAEKFRTVQDVCAYISLKANQE